MSDWIGECFGIFLFVVGLGGWAFKRLLATIDGNGAVKDAAQKGIISLIKRWLK